MSQRTRQKTARTRSAAKPRLRRIVVAGPVANTREFREAAHRRSVAVDVSQCTTMATGNIHVSPRSNFDRRRELHKYVFEQPDRDEMARRICETLRTMAER